MHVGDVIRLKSRKLIVVLLAVLALSLISTMLLSKESAATNNDIWPWTFYEPRALYSQPVNDVMAVTICDGDLRSAKVVGETGVVNVCFSVGTGSDIKFGMFRNGNISIPVAGSVHDNKMYRVLGAPCDLYTPCTYIPGADTLVTKRRLSSRLGDSVVLFNNFSKHIKKIIDPVSLDLTFSFDSENPDYIYTTDPNQVWTVGGYGASANGDWLAMEIREKGIYVLNMHTREMRRISKMTLNYFWGMAPTTEMTISNDGTHVAIMGANAYIEVFDVLNNCGDIATGDQMMFDTGLANPCRLASINTEQFIPHFFEAFHPRFNSDGGELSFYALGYLGDQREVVLGAPTYEPLRLDYLGLGDSYSSGEGETADSYYQKGTNDEYEKCHLSKRSYPYLTAKILGLKDELVKSVACSGATTNDVIGWTANYQGQGDRLKTEPLAPQQKTVAATDARENFIPGRIEQAIFVDQYQPKIITIGIGGNDVGFMDKLKTCLGLDTCEWAQYGEGREKSAVEIHNLFWTLLDTYTNLRRLSPQSAIYAVGYPKIIDPDGDCGVTLGLMFDGTERKFMDQGIMYINQIIAAAAKKAGVHYIDIENSLGNHVLCGSEKPTVINTIRLGDDSGVSSSLNNIKVIGFESFHPTPLGHEMISKVVAAAISNGTAAYACAVLDIRCYNGVNPPWPSEYWIPNYVMDDYAFQRNFKFTSDEIGSINGKQKAVNMPSGFFYENSTVHVEIHSDPLDLGEYKTDDSGALNIKLTLPSDFPDGYHTIHLYGTSFSGEKVDYYDVVNTSPVLVGANDNTDPARVLSGKSNTKAQDNKNATANGRVGAIDLNTVNTPADTGVLGDKTEVKESNINQLSGVAAVKSISYAVWLSGLATIASLLGLYTLIKRYRRR